MASQGYGVRRSLPPQQRSVNKLLKTLSLGKLKEEPGLSQEVIKLLLPRKAVSLNRIDKGGAGHAGELRYSAGKVQCIDVLQRAAASQREEAVRPQA